MPNPQTPEESMPKFYLSDDGTMDTVVTCEDCGQDARYNWGGECGHENGEHPNEGDCYDAFVEWALEDAETEHECEEATDHA